MEYRGKGAASQTRRYSSGRIRASGEKSFARESGGGQGGRAVVGAGYCRAGPGRADLHRNRHRPATADRAHAAPVQRRLTGHAPPSPAAPRTRITAHTVPRTPPASAAATTTGPAHAFAALSARSRCSVPPGPLPPVPCGTPKSPLLPPHRPPPSPRLTIVSARAVRAPRVRARPRSGASLARQRVGAPGGRVAPAVLRRVPQHDGGAVQPHHLRLLSQAYTPSCC